MQQRLKALMLTERGATYWKPPKFPKKNGQRKK